MRQISISGWDGKQIPYPWPPSLLKSSNEELRKMSSPLTEQVGGSHYKDYKIQPIEYAMANNLNYCQANAIKYVSRYKGKNGLEDLLKAAHSIKQLIGFEYGEEAAKRISILVS